MGMAWYNPPFYLFLFTPLGASYNHFLSRAVRSFCFLVLSSLSCLGKDSCRCYRQPPSLPPLLSIRYFPQHQLHGPFISSFTRK
ncbi:hypothetical protein F5144DRAFT_582196 [Chaetomium tenue]|uniref:Uncharacterized protein n=1 Tax=Chaetomium tenue TaxID=1854479 RepID=A0ACB7P0G3_9PEZI|nr:hypothetical protein F5144DRAFT_582196 [Chaetomium globosum]